ncbi:MAG: DNA-protecting protein DprA [Gammaproteobacteria bacterium]|nr:DNA-protecting protein DprA [Gammaproteobacteria bacterium]
MPDNDAPRAEEWPYWLALCRAPGVGPVNFMRLTKRFSTPRAVFSASNADLAETGAKGKLQEYLRAPDWKIIEQDMQWLALPGNYLLTIQDTRYPRRLREIHDPPPILFVQGDLSLLSTDQLAMVGSRNPSRGGEITAFEFAEYLSKTGLVITSGLAFGIDAVSHRGAMAGGGKTIAIMGTGLDRVYPSQHRDLARQIVRNGALVSEFPPGTQAQGRYFPRRNRIISGLSLGVLVVEATARSGSLITARQAAEQGREVFAIPGSIHNPLAKGCHILLKEGAKLVETAADIIEELPVFQPLSLVAETSAVLLDTENHSNNQSLDEDYEHMLAHMGIDEPVSVDSLVERCGLTPEAVSSMLLVLELRGFVVSQTSGRYTRIGRNLRNNEKITSP